MLVITESKKFKFKITRPTGRYKSFDNPYMSVKLKEGTVGSVSAASHFSKIPMDQLYGIHLMVVNETESCGWNTVTLKKRFPDLDSAKLFLNENFNAILCKYELYIQKD